MLFLVQAAMVARECTKNTSPKLSGAVVGGLFLT